MAERQKTKTTSPRVMCPKCKKRVARLPESTKTHVAYPAKCPHCSADLLPVLADERTRTEAPADHSSHEPDKGKKDRPDPIADLCKRTPGRPTKLSDDLILEVARGLALGAYNTTVMKALGIKERTWYAWIDKGIKAEAKPPSKRTKADLLYLKFAMVTEQADAMGEMAALAEVRSGGFGWQGSAWFLERKHPDRWGRSRAEGNEGGSLDALVDAIKAARDAQSKQKAGAA